MDQVSGFRLAPPQERPDFRRRQALQMQPDGAAAVLRQLRQRDLDLPFQLLSSGERMGRRVGRGGQTAWCDGGRLIVLRQWILPSCLRPSNARMVADTATL